MLASPSNARDYVANDIDIDALAIAMQASEEVRDKISTIERDYKDEKAIHYETNVYDNLFKKSEITVIGACLNVNDENEEDITLATGSNAVRNQVSMNFRKAEPNPQYTDSSTYGNAIAVDISLLINGEECEKLEVPIVIKVPVPNDIKPSRLVIIHEKSAGDEQIIPRITYEDGKAYAWITVKEFSVFVFAEQVDDSPSGDEENHPEETVNGGDKYPSDETGNNSNGNGHSSSSSSGGGSPSNSKSSKAQTIAKTQTIDGTNYTWKQNDTGWWLEDSSGKYPTNAWAFKDNIWYYLGSDGYMVTGWNFIDNQWYYFHGNGAMMYSAWLEYNGSWYFVGQNGSMYTGWLEVNGKWYYLDSTGAMIVNTSTPDGYYVGANGEWIQ